MEGNPNLCMKVQRDVGVGTSKSRSRISLEWEAIESESLVYEIDMESPTNRVASPG